ncbi:MAG TPA: Dabb family protein [Bryobacteraceae bacterium]|nr:Dabb family protein [Bryobacteraceae bacterium]
MTKRLFLGVCAASLMMLGQSQKLPTRTFALAAATNPKTVIHVISIQWKADATPAQIDKAIKAAEALPAEYRGITRVWTKPIKKQLPEGYSHVIVMEFASEDALTKYAGSPAQKKWYEVYMPIREESRTSDITN